MVSPRQAARTLVRAPFVTAVAVASLALGIGANAAIFSLVDRVLLRPLPVADPGRLVNLGAPGPSPGMQSCSNAGDCTQVFSYPMFRDLEKAQTAFSGIAAHRDFSANLAHDGQTSNGQGLLVSGSYFSVLGLRPALGRLFNRNDDRNIGGDFLAVLSYDYWVTHMGASRAVLNTSLVVNGHAMTIVGVAPRGFEGTTLGNPVQVFVPITMRNLMIPGAAGFESRRAYWAYLFARLKPGATIAQATTAINSIYRPIIENVEGPLQKGISDETLQRFRAKRITLEPGERGQSTIHKDARGPLAMLFSVTAIVLLIACANVANLLLARGVGRSLEMATRLSLGARPWQLLAQLLLEVGILAILGGAVSLLVAQWTLKGIGSVLPVDATAALHFRIEPSVLVFAGLLSFATGLLFGLFPAWRGARPDLMAVVRASTGQPSGGRGAARFRTVLVTAQVGLSMTLLILAGLFVKSLTMINRQDLGVKVDHLVAFGVTPDLNGYEPARSRAFFERLEDGLAALPGATSVSSAQVPILSGDNWDTGVRVEGFASGPDVNSNSRYNEIGPDYFRTLGVPLITGREFTRADALGAAKVAIVNEAFARKFNLGRDVVGKHMSTGGENLDIEIVGLVPDTKYSDVKLAPPPLFFTPYRQDEAIGQLVFYVRTTTPPEDMLHRIPGVVARLDPNLPVIQMKTMAQQIRENIVLDRLIGTLSAAFAVLATILAAVGLYGVLAYTVARRTREIGVRMALGGDARTVSRMVLRQVGAMTLVGGGIGILAALALGRLAGSLLFAMTGSDPVVISVAVVVLVMVAFTAGAVPALRAARVDPMQALRYE